LKKYTLNISASTGLAFPANETAGSDIRLVWDGSNLLDRDDHSAVWLWYPLSQSDYYAVTWHSCNTGIWFNCSDAYSFGAHPYPCDGTYDGNGNATYDGGGDHYFEIAGIGAEDRIFGPDGPFEVTKGQWYAQARTCATVSTNLRHRYYPDIQRIGNEYIEKTVTRSSVYGDSPADPAFYFGASDWRTNQPSSGQNDETPYGYLRGLRLFDAELSYAEIVQEINAIGNNTAASTTGLANTWYINDNPTPTDVTDKSAANHDPSWANANRPSLWEA